MVRPPDPPEPPAEPPLGPDDETVVRDSWGPESETFVERTVEEEPPRRRPPTLWPWLLGLLLLVLGGLGALWYFTQEDDDESGTTTSTLASTVVVPDVVGTTSSEATATLREAGLEVNVVSVPSDDAPAGQVIAQDPGAGDEVDEGSSVRLNVAREADTTTTGTTTEGTTTTGETTTGGTTTAETTTTDTTPTTTAAPEPAVVPDVVGGSLADAARAFGDEGLKVAVVYVPSNEPRGSVVAQAQPPGTELEQGDTVQVNASRGANPPADASVPDVVGLERDDARERLGDAGFEVLAIELGESDEDEVVSQSPAAGASIPRGSLVLLYLGD